MKKHLVLLLAFILVSVSNLSAKTIWIVDETNNHSSMVSFYNSLIEDLKLTKYNQYLKKATDIRSISKQNGDILLYFRGNSGTTNTGNITYFYWIGCIIDNCNDWAFDITGDRLFTDHYKDESVRIIKDQIIQYLDTSF